MAISQKIHKRHSKNKYRTKKIRGGVVTVKDFIRPIVDPYRAIKSKLNPYRERLGTRAQEEKKGIYTYGNTIKQLYVCSDLEGANVFNFDGNIPGIPDNMDNIERIEEIEKLILEEESTFDSNKILVQR